MLVRCQAGLKGTVKDQGVKARASQTIFCLGDLSSASPGHDPREALARKGRVGVAVSKKDPHC